MADLTARLKKIEDQYGEDAADAIHTAFEILLDEEAREEDLLELGQAVLFYFYTVYPSLHDHIALIAEMNGKVLREKID